MEIKIVNGEKHNNKQKHVSLILVINGIFGIIH